MWIAIVVVIAFIVVVGFFIWLSRALNRDEKSASECVPQKTQQETPTLPPSSPVTSSSLEETTSSVQPSQSRRVEAVAESVVCDICSRRISSPNGYLLTTREVVSMPKYWRHYYQHHKSEFTAMGILAYEDFCNNSLLRTSCGQALAGQRTPWIICENCISMFDVDREKTRGYAKQWWQSKRTYQPPGTGPAPLSAINM
jgi:hypothetical protein